MTEQLSIPEQNRIISEPELLFLGAACVEAAGRPDLQAVAAEHSRLLANPNSVGGGLFVAGEVPMQGDKVYRQVGQEAIEDLARSGIVRNGATARGEEHRRWGHKVFWNQGEDGKAMNTGGRFVLEAPAEAAANGWITADQVTAIHTRMPNGEVKDILGLH